VPAPSNNQQAVGGLVFEFDSSSPLTSTVTLNFTVTQAQLSNLGLQPNQVLIEYYNTTTSQWTSTGVTTTYTYANGTYTFAATSTHFSTWGVFSQSFSSSTVGGNDLIAPIPANSGDNVCFYTTSSNIASANWIVYSVAGYRVATLNFSNNPTSQCWNTAGVGHGLYYVKIELTYTNGTTANEWFKAVVR